MVKCSKFFNRNNMLDFINKNPNVNIVSIVYESGEAKPHVLYYSIDNNVSKQD